ncbi:bcl-2-like protein 11 isoform X2, partial [Tachysurus ichikawai]
MLNYLAVLWKTREREHLFVVVLLSVAHTHERRIKSRRDVNCTAIQSFVMPRTRASVSRFVPLIYSVTSPWARAPLLMFTAVWNIPQRGLNCALHRPRQNRADGPAFLKEQGERGESGSRAEPCESPQPGELDVFYRAAIAVPNIRVAYQSRSPVFRTLSRSSSGYFSFDSEPSSPLITHSTATQTPSPSSQVITHALQRISEARGDAHNHELWPALHNHYPPHGAASAGDMQAEREIARELRRIGDEFNQLYFRE